MKKFIFSILLVISAASLKAQYASINAILDRLEERRGINQNLQNLSGNIFLIAVNIDAYNYYLKQWKPEIWRFVDYNMNRIVWKNIDPKYSEQKRFLELKDIIENLDIALDLHSVPIWNEVIGICDQRLVKQSQSFMNVQYLLADDVDNSGALISLLTKQNKPAFGIECGNHTDKSAFEVWVANVLSFLGFYKIFDISDKQKISKNGFLQETYWFLEEIIPQTKNFKFVKSYKNFEKISPKQTFAIDWDKKYINNFDKDIYIWFIHSNIQAWQGCGFLFEKLC